MKYTILSIRQPWAWLICEGYKDIENRTWTTHFRGEFLIHAGLKLDDDFWREGLDLELLHGAKIRVPRKEEFERGGIVGRAKITDCVDSSPSPWFFGPYGFVLREAEPLPFIPMKGKLGFFQQEVKI